MLNAFRHHWNLHLSLESRPGHTSSAQRLSASLESSLHLGVSVDCRQTLCSTPFGIIGIFTAWVPNHVGKCVYTLLFVDLNFLIILHWSFACNNSQFIPNLLEINRIIACKYLNGRVTVISLCNASVFHINIFLKGPTSVDACEYPKALEKPCRSRVFDSPL